jgi:hypothetical protein
MSVRRHTVTILAGYVVPMFVSPRPLERSPADITP